MTDAFVLRRETQIAAPPATVFAYLTDPQKILSWMGMEANTEPHPGGLYLIKGVGHTSRTARGTFREVVPVHRLAYSFGWDDSDEVPPGSGLIEIDLIDRDGGTLLRMTHSGSGRGANASLKWKSRLVTSSQKLAQPAWARQPSASRASRRRGPTAEALLGCRCPRVSTGDLPPGNQEGRAIPAPAPPGKGRMCPVGPAGPRIVSCVGPRLWYSQETTNATGANAGPR